MTGHEAIGTIKEITIIPVIKNKFGLDAAEVEKIIQKC